MWNYPLNLAEQLGLPEETLALLAGLGGFVGGLRPTHRAMIILGAATVAGIIVKLTVKSLKKRNVNENGNGMNRMPILNGSELTSGVEEVEEVVELQ